MEWNTQSMRAMGRTAHCDEETWAGRAARERTVMRTCGPGGQHVSALYEGESTAGLTEG